MRKRTKAEYAPIPERDIKIGTAVNYHPVIGRSDCTPTRIRSEIWELGHGEKIVKVEGVAGGVSLMALSAREEGKTT